MIQRHPDPEGAHPGADAAPESLVSVVTVLFNSGDVIGGCLAALPSGVDVVVVDNASSDDGVAVALAARPDVVLVRAERNVGFGAGCNLGWHAASRPYVAFVNPDVRLEPDALDTLVGRLEHEGRAIVGPSVPEESGAMRLCKRPPSLLNDVTGMLPAASRWAPPGHDGKLPASDPVHRLGGRVSAVEGACFLMRRTDLEAIGGFDEDYFLYYEEEGLAHRLARLGGYAYYEPAASAVHSGETSMAKVRPIATYHRHRSRVIFYRKRDGPLRGWLSGLAMALAALVSMPSALFNEIMGRTRRATVSHQWHALRGLLAGLVAPIREGGYRD